MKIKVCGITSFRQMQMLQELGVDFAGMIFYPGSKRCVREEMYDSQALIRNLNIKRIGVFVNQPYEEIIKAISDFDLYAIQLHGDETDEFCLEFMDKVKVIKVFRLGNEVELDTLIAPYQEVCHYFLFDTETIGYGGSGKKFNWKLLENGMIKKPFFLSGGIGLDDIESLQGFTHPYLHAVDVNSKFEVEPGVKDMNMVRSFLKQLSHG